VITGLFLHRIHPTTPIAVPALLLFGVGWHFYDRNGIGENMLSNYLVDFLTDIHVG
jgi:hypothetical protein